MTILQVLAQIPIMLYVSLVFLPAVLFGYFFVSKPQKTAAPAAASPANPPDEDEKKTGFRKEFFSSLFLGASIAFGFAVVFFASGIISDYKSNKGLFAAVLPVATFPPSPNFVLPPAPPAQAAEAATSQ